MAEPRAWAERLEREPRLPAALSAPAERLAGYGVMGLPFASGHVLALRRFPASSIGPGFTSVWHRAPDGAWTFYADAPPAQACPRYFADSAARTVLAPIRLTWSAERALEVRIEGDVRLDWELTLAPTPATRALTALGSVLPEAAWRRRWALALLGRVAGPTLRSGRVRLHGHTPNRQWFVVNPLLIWAVRDSRARLGGRDLGPPAPLARQARLADFWLPQRGLFAVGRAFVEPFDAARHLGPAARTAPEGIPRSANGRSGGRCIAFNSRPQAAARS